MAQTPCRVKICTSLDPIPVRHVRKEYDVYVDLTAKDSHWHQGSSPDDTYLHIAALREASLLKYLPSHPRIVSLSNTTWVHHCLSLVMPYYPYRLRDVIAKACKDTHRCEKYAIQMTEALAHCHRYQVVHRDLKPENIMVTETDDLVLIDFGLARSMSHASREDGSTNYVVSIYYRAPELMAQGDTVSSDYDAMAVDIWALGCVLMELLTGKEGGPFAFPSCHDMTLDDRIDAMIQRLMPTTDDEVYVGPVLHRYLKTHPVSWRALRRYPPWLHARSRHRHLNPVIDACLQLHPDYRSTASNLMALLVRVCSCPNDCLGNASVAADNAMTYEPLSTVALLNWHHGRLCAMPCEPTHPSWWSSSGRKKCASWVLELVLEDEPYVPYHLFHLTMHYLDQCITEKHDMTDVDRLGHWAFASLWMASAYCSHELGLTLGHGLYDVQATIASLTPYLHALWGRIQGMCIRPTLMDYLVQLTSRYDDSVFSNWVYHLSPMVILCAPTWEPWLQAEWLVRTACRHLLRVYTPHPDSLMTRDEFEFLEARPLEKYVIAST